jgi:hypothetical protein
MRRRTCLYLIKVGLHSRSNVELKKPTTIVCVLCGYQVLADDRVQARAAAVGSRLRGRWLYRRVARPIARLVVTARPSACLGRGSVDLRQPQSVGGVVC